jgi:GAF domain-containing protein
MAPRAATASGVQGALAEAPRPEASEGPSLGEQLQQRTSELNEALLQQQATAAVLKTISRGGFDLPPVLESVVASAVRLCSADSGIVYRLDGGLLRLAATLNMSPEFKDYVEHHPIRAGRGTAAARALQECRTVHIPDVAADTEYDYPAAHTLGRIRAILGVPMLKQGVPIGVMTIWRSQPQAFSDRQIDLLTGFADQAAIAIENTRLLQALQARNRELGNALEQQTATGEILRAISRSPIDVQPVFEAIVNAALKLCEARSACVHRLDGDRLDIAALAMVDPGGEEAIRSLYPRRADLSTVSGRAVLSRRLVEIPDVMEDAGYGAHGAARGAGFRSMLGVPMLREGQSMGAIVVGKPDPGPFPPHHVALLQTFADQAVIAIENARLFNETRQALDHQTAIGEVLRVISRSPTDVAPVFEAILDSATRLLGTPMAAVFRYDGRLVHQVAVRDWPPEAVEDARRYYPGPPSARMLSGRVILSGQLQVQEDAFADPTYDQRLARLGLWRRMVGAPLLKDGTPIGAIVVAWRDAGHTPQRQIDLLRTFADQAVIAIENARLFNETQEAFERLTATSEVLQVISSSPTDVQPVLDTVAERSGLLCHAQGARVWLVEDGHLRAMTSYGPAYRAEAEPEALPLRRTSIGGRAFVERRCIHVEDVLPLIDSEYPDIRELQARYGFRTVLAVPMLREEEAIGVISLLRQEVRPFTDTEVNLVQTFADQAVIAIENARLFKELQARNTQLTEALSQQTATGEILRVISRSPTDVQPVFEAIAAAALALCRATATNVLTYDGKLLHLAARATALPENIDAALAIFPRPAGTDTVAGQAILGRGVAVIPDVSKGPEYFAQHVARLSGSRSLMSVPLMREGTPIGAISIGRPETGPVPDQQIALLQTFADQAVIAIENVRLFKELQEKGLQLELASRHKSRFLANMSHELRTPLNAIIGFTRIVMRRCAGQLEPKQAENLEKILASGQHLLALINAILDLSKIEAGHVQVDARETELAPVLEQCLLTVEPLVHAEAVTLSAELDATLPPLFVDDEKLRQIVINLLSNAAKFTQCGRIVLSARATGEGIAISVADTGIGIEAEKLQLVFEEFEQADASSTRLYGGTGLGLTIARRLARLMGGDIEARSAPSQGSTFTLYLPLRYRPPGCP